MIPPPPRSTLFPYTTLFRSISGTVRCSRTVCSTATPWNASGESPFWPRIDRKSTRLNSSHGYISYAVFCLKKKKKKRKQPENKLKTVEENTRVRETQIRLTH